MKTTKHIPVLDGLRFFAAFFVIASHYSHWIVNDQGVTDQLSVLLAPLSALGMALFFVLSGFVIHFNYHDICRQPGGNKRFFIARFTRIYPLFIVMFAIEFFSSFHYARVACGFMTPGIPGDNRWGALIALPYYLTLTQNWFYGIICQKSLVTQYHMVSDVSWSLSLELFFYIAYVFFVFWLSAQKNIAKQLIVAAIAQLLVIGYFLLCWRYRPFIDHIALIAFGPAAAEDIGGYENSLNRWLYYFNPFMNLAAFFFGALAANIYLAVRNQPMTNQKEERGGWIAITSVIIVLAVHLWLYDIAQTNGFIGRTASSLYAPLIAVMIYYLTRYPNNLFSRIMSTPFFVKLGEASYSIYLLHAFFAWNARDFYFLKLNPWLLYTIAILCVLAISRGSYVCFERPVQRWLRGKMMKKGSL